MIPFLKNFVKYLYRGKIILLSGVLIFLFLSAPSPVLANPLEKISNFILAIPTVFVGTILTLIIYLTGAIASFMGSILDWVISPSFISLSYTNPSGNPIIGMGLNITQSFVNMILVVILVYIALSIALRIGEQDAKKIFPKLIAIALLVNFTPVICGLIVDAANITMNYFLELIQGGVAGVLDQTRPNMAEVGNAIKGAGATIPNKLGLLTLISATIFLHLSTAFIFFLFAGLFLFRYIAIWVLVILSPLAFAFWILPATKKLWDMWWNNFIQWSIIGIPMAFFLYLGLGSYSLISTAFKATLAMPEAGETASVGGLNQMFPFFVVIVFLALGFIVGLSTSAMGAAAIIKGGKAAGMVAGKRGWGLAKAGPVAAYKAAAGTYDNIAETYRAKRNIGLSVKQAAGGAIKTHWRSRTLPAIKSGGRTVKETFITKAGAKRAGVGIWRGSGIARRGAGSVLKDMGAAGLLAGAPEVAKALGIAEKKKKERPTCSKCGNFVPANSTNCPHCGTAMPICQKCKKPVAPGVKFCHRCGTLASRTPSPPTPPTPPTTPPPTPPPPTQPPAGFRRGGGRTY